MKNKLEIMREPLGNEAYLRDGYNENKLYGNRDGEVEFDTMLEWLFENQHEVEMMVEMANKIERVK